MRVSADRILYLSRVIARKLKENMNLIQKSDDETVRRAIVRVMTETYKELDAIEEKVQASMAKRKNVAARDQEQDPVRRLHAVLETYALVTMESRGHHDNELAASMHRDQHVHRAEHHDRDLRRRGPTPDSATGYPRTAGWLELQLRGQRRAHRTIQLDVAHGERSHLPHRVRHRADFELGVNLRREVPGQLDAVALEGVEPGQRERDRVSSGPQVHDAVLAATV